MNVLITGATKGIGQSVALSMAQNGHHLAICARDNNDLINFKSKIKSLYPSINVFTKAVDCSKKQEVENFATDALTQFGQIDVLINNVGIFIPACILKEEDDLLDVQFRTNVAAAYYLYKKIAPGMVKNHFGYIFNVCSVASKKIIANAGSYCVTKAAMLSLNHIMREEMMPHQVKVTAILPGSTLTSSWEGTDLSPDKFVQPQDVAAAIENALMMSKGANVSEIIIEPLSGQL